MKKYVITGGPCTGKTTLLLALKEKGYEVVEEAPRAIIQEELEKEKLVAGYRAVVPWANLEQFQRLVLRKQKDLEAMIKSEIAFLDRSAIDCIAYAKLGNIKLDVEHYDYISKAGYTKAFFLQMLPFYIKDNERKEDADFAKALHEELYNAYSSIGISIIQLPPVSVEERLKIVLKEI